jgi:hypothetical protein
VISGVHQEFTCDRRDIRPAKVVGWSRRPWRVYACHEAIEGGILT